MAKNLPEHIAIIMDGNGRWAEQHHLPRREGHKAGYQAARRVVQHCGNLGIKVLTLFAFSSENWARPQTEINDIMDLFYRALNQEIDELHQNNVRVKVIGDTSQLSEKLQKAIIADQEMTAKNTGLTLVLAVNYGGRWDIVQATKHIALAVSRGDIHTDDIDTKLFSHYVSTAEFPDPDLFIRPSGEQRISNFLNWQLAYSELYFPEQPWPDFNAAAIDAAVEFFQTRERRYGMTSQQIRELQGE